MGLESLENGFDSIQIRLWYGYGYPDTAQLVILTKAKNKEWKAELIDMIYDLDSLDHSLLSISHKKVIGTPNKGWKNFTNALFRCDIISLPDCYKIRGYHGSMGGRSLIVEIGRCRSYRIYSYSNPASMASYFDEAEKLERALKLIETEFNYPRLK